MTPMRVAFIGLRGVPATVGGVEHHVEQLGSRLAARGHEVTVYCRTNYVTERLDEHLGMRLVHLPTVNAKYLDAIVHSGLSTLRALQRPPDVVHYQAVGPGLLAPLPRYLSRAKVVLTVHGLDHQRDKWGGGGRTVLRTAGWMSARVPDATITVSRALAEHYGVHHRRSAEYIPNGVVAPRMLPAREITERWGLTAGSYVLFLGRLVPEKAPDLLISAFARLAGDVKLVIAGSTGFTDAYVARLHRMGERDPRVIFTGAVQGATVHELYTNARAFVLPSRLEGLPLTLLEAASHGTPVVVSDIAPHLEVVEGDAPGHRVFRCDDEADLVRRLSATVLDPAPERAGAASFAHQVIATYRWDAVTEATEAVYARVLRSRGRGAMAHLGGRDGGLHDRP